MTKCIICDKSSMVMFTRNNEYYCIDCNENYGIDPKDLNYCDRCGRLRKLDSFCHNGFNYNWCSSCFISVYPD